MKNLVTRGAGLVAVAALVASAGSVPAQAAPIAVPVGADRTPVALGAAYLAAQAGASNIITTYYVAQSGATESYEDYGLTIDAAWALEAANEQAAKRTAMTDALQANIDNYAFGGGSQAKLLAFLTSQNRTGQDITDLRTDLEDHIDPAAPNEANYGRLVDPGATGVADFNSPLTQAYAAQALNRSASTKAVAALDFLLKQQCTGTGNGFFRADFADKTSDQQNCNNASADLRAPSVDTTAVAVLALQDQKNSNATVSNRINQAIVWLTQAQAADGSFKNTDGVANANSTGLAGWALAVSGIRPNAAERAAAWLRGHQLVNVGGCAPFAAGLNGVVVGDDLGLANAVAGPLSQAQQSSATRATTQALPGLVSTAGADVKLTAPTGFVHSSTSQPLTIAGAGGDTVCVTAGATASRVVLNGTGAGSANLAMPATTGSFIVTSTDSGGEVDAATYKVLAPTKLKVDVRRAKIRKGQKAVVKVKGLAVGEKVSATYRGKTVSGVANAKGKAKLRFKANKAGNAKVKVVGQFADRKGKAKLRVIARR